MLSLRAVSGIIGALIILACLYTGKYPFALLVLVILLIGLIEFINLTLRKKSWVEFFVPLVGGLMIFFASLVLKELGLAISAVFSLILFLFWFLLSRKNRNFSQVSTLFFGSFYISLSFSYLFLIRSLPNGVDILLFLFLATWAFDVFAYFFGTFLGRHKLVPLISPNKTWEGLLAGFLACFLVFLLSYLLRFFSFLTSLSFFIVVGVSVPLGDLIESKLKREFKVKDSGFVIPGHGGILDRFDGLMLAAIFTFYFFKVFS